MTVIFIISGIIIFILFHLFYKNKYSNSKTTIAILPNIMKIAGLIILFACIIAPGFLKINETVFLSELRNLFILLGLILICLSKEKDENPIHNHLRYLLLFVSLFTVVLVFQVFILFNCIEKQGISIVHLPIGVLMFYLILFHWYKWKLKQKFEIKVK